MRKPHQQFRDVHNGKFGFDGDFDRLCKCGHRLAVHGPAGVECLAGTNIPDDPNSRGVECDCVKFKPTGKRAPAPQTNPALDPATVEACADCGKDEPCDENCPNHQTQEPGPSTDSAEKKEFDRHYCEGGYHIGSHVCKTCKCKSRVSQTERGEK